MLLFFASVGFLILGYFIYGRLVDRLFGSDPARKTPAETLCKRVAKAIPGEYQLTMAQKGDELTIMENTARRPYKGFLEADNPRQVQVRGTYADAGGYVTEEVLIQFAGTGSGTGQSVWRWSDGWHQCGGRFLLTLKKKRP